MESLTLAFVLAAVMVAFMALVIYLALRRSGSPPDDSFPDEFHQEPEVDRLRQEGL